MGISVIMPTYNQGAFIRRAIASLYRQIYQEWELIIINDGSSDYTIDMLSDYLIDERIRYFENPTNIGLGGSLNKGLKLTSFPYICYLPSDDIYYENHLSSLYQIMKESPSAILCYSGVNHHHKDTERRSEKMSAIGKIPGYPLQLVQVMHRQTNNVWMERDELVTDNLARMFWSKLEVEGEFVKSGAISCEWVDHPWQRHQIIQEDCFGGIYHYKKYYKVNQPIRFHSTIGSLIDEIEEYRFFRQVPEKQDQLKILIVGELGYNPERLNTLERMGHQLYGLWIDNPVSYNAVGPLPFGNIINLSSVNWQEEVNQIKPDLIYGLLNYHAVPFANSVMRVTPNIPFIWHFKEGPFFCRNFGMWNELVELYCNADGRIYINSESERWFSQFIPDSNRPTMVLDGDLPPNQWFNEDKSPLLSDRDGAIHTVISGRAYGITPTIISELAQYDIHVHMYGNHSEEFQAYWFEKYGSQIRGHLHFHNSCKTKDWVKEYSQYDAGWLHVFNSNNHGELMKCTWDDLNYPARMATMAASGLPMIQKNNHGHVVASKNLVRSVDMGVFFDSIVDLATQLKDKKRMMEIRTNVWKNRHIFSFDYHAEHLVDFFKEVIQVHKNKMNQE